MLARRKLPDEWVLWNRRWGAPFGSQSLTARLVRRLRRIPPLRRSTYLHGYFEFQANNSIRVAEYPWAFHATPLHPGMTALDIGGSLGGFQFVLDRLGLEVHNCDPGEAANGLGWPVTPGSINRLNRRFGTSVALHNTFLQDLELPAQSFDRIFSISTIEHIPETELPSLMQAVRRLLRPGGYFIATVDLFLDLVPFSRVATNRWGTNIDVNALVRMSCLQLSAGVPTELHGYPEFDARHVMGLLPELLIGQAHPALAQCIVLHRPHHDQSPEASRVGQSKCE